MASAIDPTVPVAGNPTTATVRANFAAAKSEIEALQGSAGGGTPGTPTALVGAAAIPGVATTYMRSDAAPALATIAGVVGTWTNSNITVDNTGRITAAANGAAGAGGLPLAGGTMTGPLTLAADPQAPLQAATQQYVDAQIQTVAGGTVSTPYNARTTSQAMANPGNGLVAWNTVAQTTATQISVAVINGGTPADDVHSMWANIAAGQSLHIQRSTDHTQEMIYTITSLTDNTTWFLLNVTAVSSTGAAFTNNQGLTVLLPSTANVFLPIAGGTLTGKLVTAVPVAASAGFNLPPAAAPTTLVNGDLWTTATGVFAQINGAPVGPFGVAGVGSGVDTVAPAVTAAGATQAAAFVLVSQFNVVTTVAVGTGVALPTAPAVGSHCLVRNSGANPLAVYPASAVGTAINNLGANAAITVAVNSTAYFECLSATQWFTVP
jgi:hypothetical protein